MCALPLVLSLADDDELLLDPVPELESLRSDHLALKDLRLSDRDDVRLDITGDALENLGLCSNGTMPRRLA